MFFAGFPTDDDDIFIRFDHGTFKTGFRQSVFGFRIVIKRISRRLSGVCAK
jgi:hypothetical protein